MGRHTFSEQQATELRAIFPALSRARVADDRAQAKALRDSLRKLGFYITDWDETRQGFEPSDFDRLVSEGTITITRPDDG